MIVGFRRHPSIAHVLWAVWRRTAVVTTALGLVCVAIFIVAFGVLHPRLHRAIEVSNATQDLGAGLTVQETALRGLLATGDGQFLDAYTGAVHQVQRARVPIESFDSPRTRELLVATDAWQDQWAAVALLPRGGKPDAAFLREGDRLAGDIRDAHAAASVELSRNMRVQEESEGVLLGLGIAVALASVVAGLAVSRRGLRGTRAAIGKPLHSLMESIDGLGAGARPDLLDPGAPVELRELGDRLAHVGARLSAGRARTTALLEVQHAIAFATLDEQHAMELITAQVRALTSADAAVVELREGDEMVYAAGDGTARDHVGLRLPIHGSASGRCATTGISARIDDVEADPNMDAAVCLAVGLRSTVVVPLRHDGVIIGVLKVYSDRPAAFTTEDEETLDLLSGLAAVAIHNARTHTASIDARLAVERSEERFRSLYHRSPVGQTEVALDGTVMHVNDVFATMLGRTPDDLVGTAAGELLVRSQDGTEFTTALRRMRAGEITHYTGRRVYRHTAGHPVTALISVGLVTTGDGEQHIIGTAVDITDSERAREALADSEEQLQRMFDAAPVGIMVRDHDGRIVAANGAFADILGYDVADLVGVRAQMLTHSDDPVASGFALDRITGGDEEVVLLERRLRRADGTPVWVSTTSTAMEYDGRQRVLTYVADVTERREAGDRLAHLALYDQLTGLPNRVAALDALDATQQAGEPVAVLFIDLDGFKAVNDQYGHQTGDAVLAKTASRLTAVVRPHDVTARLAGDEFVIICPGLTDETGARALADRIETTLRAPMLIGDATVQIGASIGIAMSAAGDDTSALLSTADAAMYEAKRANKRHPATTRS
jgi:diguanylate cyclase (GGDEF)-like protein/PAS domain S-box-containing protein